MRLQRTSVDSKIRRIIPRLVAIRDVWSYDKKIKEASVCREIQTALCLLLSLDFFLALHQRFQGHPTSAYEAFRGASYRAYVSRS